MRNNLVFGLLFVLVVNSQALHAQLSKYSEVYLLTYLPGNELYSLFGHSALRVRDPVNGIDLVYNYGTFDFSEPFFYIKFINGNLPYYLSRSSYTTALKQMKLENREVLEQRLSLTWNEKNTLFNQLETDYLPENRSYMYRFFKNNCATKIRDAIESVINEPIKYESTSYKLSFRQLIHKYLEEWPWVKLGIDLMLGEEADNLADTKETMFLPDYLTFHFALATVKRAEGIHSLATRPVKIVDNQKMEHVKFLEPSLFFIFILVSLLILAPKFYPKKSSFVFLDITIFGVSTIYGLILLYVALQSNQPELYPNYNMLWSLPAIVPLSFHLSYVKISARALTIGYIIYVLLLVGIMIGNKWIKQSIPIDIYPFLFIVIIHTGLKAIKLI